MTNVKSECQTAAERSPIVQAEWLGHLAGEVFDCMSDFSGLVRSIMKIVISPKSSFQRSIEREGATKGRQRQRKQRYRKSDVAPRVTKRRKGRTTNIENPNNTLFTRTRVTRVTQVTQVYCFGIFPKETTAPLQQDLQELRTAKVVQRMHVQNLVLLRT